MQIDFDIGHILVRLEGPEHMPAHAWPLAPFDRFVSDSSTEPDIVITVEVVTVLPELVKGTLHFDACEGLWRIHHSPDGLVLDSLDTQTLTPRLRAVIRDDYTRVHAWLLPHMLDGREGWVPMHVLNPVGEVCLITRLARSGGLALHGAGITGSQGGYVFTGPSGAGKSTISAFFAERGDGVLSDERIFLRRSGQGTTVHGTPWVGSGNYATNGSAQLTGLFAIRHGGDEHRVTALGPGSFMSRILEQSFLPHWDRQAMEETLAFLDDVFHQVPHADLAFAKRADITSFVDAQPLAAVTS